MCSSNSHMNTVRVELTMYKLKVVCDMTLYMYCIRPMFGDQSIRPLKITFVSFPSSHCDAGLKAVSLYN